MFFNKLKLSWKLTDFQCQEKKSNLSKFHKKIPTFGKCFKHTF